jgi:hypothetical protein
VLVNGQVIKGTTITLKCSAEGIVVTYEWYKGTTKFTSSVTGAKKEEFSKKMDDADAGDYTCKAINTGGNTGSDKLTLKIVGEY